MIKKQTDSSTEHEIIKEAHHWIRANKGASIGGVYSSPRISSEISDCSMPLTFDHFNYCSLGCLYCVPAGTKILMSNGREKVIERIRAGETVLSLNVDTSQPETSIVTEIMNRVAKETIIIELEEGTILELTPEHPIWTGDKWVAAGELKEGLEVLVW